MASNQEAQAKFTPYPPSQSPSAIKVTSEKPSLAELKNGKVIFKQKPVSFEKHSETMKGIVGFRTLLEERIENKLPPLTSIPDEHMPIIAKLAHESDKTLSAISKHIHQELLPIQDADEEDTTPIIAALPVSAVEAAIKKCMDRNNYGLDPPPGFKSSANVSAWRWEVKEPYREWLPKNAREKAEMRLAERIEAKQNLASMFDALAEEEKCQIFTGYKAPVQGTSLPNSQSSSQPTTLTNDSASASKELPKLVPEGEENNSAEASSSKAGKPKKPTDPEKAAKEKEKAEKKAAKVEKEKREKEAQNKSRSLMNNFFKKPSIPVAKAAPAKVAAPVAAAADSCTMQSDFERTFKPFVVKKDAELAPNNWFLRRKTRPADSYITIIDDDDIREVPREPDHMQVDETEVIDVSQMSAKDRLNSAISSLVSSGKRRCSDRPPGLKTYGGVAVRDVLTRLSEAEVTGDTALVRSLLSQLSDRSRFPAKVLIFREDARPGYFGTWTRSSRFVGPRTPFAKDVLQFDYGYDSGEEWEDEPSGDADDVVDGEDEEIDSEDRDSDLDDWLVDDDEELDGPPSRELSQPPDVPLLPQKRKPEDADKKIGKKRKVVVPLVPFVKGPCWESTIGKCEYAPFSAYKIRHFNDSPFPLDPFTFVSAGPEAPNSKMSTNINGPPVAHRSNVPPLAPPPIPSSSTAPPVSAPVAKKPAHSGPKTAFPDAHLPFLIDKITTLQAASLTYLVEMIYQDLRTQKVKKNAIEAKIREVGEKCKDKKVWVLKQNMPPPSIAGV